MISQTAEYALRAAVALAQAGDQPLTTATLAERTKVKKPYMSKVMQLLIRTDLINAIRGLYGGYQLARPADEISILAVINAVDPLKRITSCPLGLKEHGVNLCPLHRQLDDAMARVEDIFSSTMLTDLINEPTGSIPLCPGPAAAEGR